MGGKVVDVTDMNFEQEVLKSDKVVFVDFWAPWCPPCKMFGPIVEETSMEVSDAIKICKCNTDENSTTATNYGIMSIPTIIIFKNGAIVYQSAGTRSKEDLKKLLEKYI